MRHRSNCRGRTKYACWTWNWTWTLSTCTFAWWQHVDHIKQSRRKLPNTAQKYVYLRLKSPQSFSYYRKSISISITRAVPEMLVASSCAGAASITWKWSICITCYDHPWPTIPWGCFGASNSISASRTCVRLTLMTLLLLLPLRELRH